MNFRFIGKYTNGRTSIATMGHVFVGHEPTQVEGAEAIRRLTNHVEFEAVEETEDAAAPKRRGRKPKAAE